MGRYVPAFGLQCLKNISWFRISPHGALVLKRHSNRDYPAGLPSLEEGTLFTGGGGGGGGEGGGGVGEGGGWRRGG